MQPRHDPSPRMSRAPRFSASLVRLVEVSTGQRRRLGDQGLVGEPCPVEPNRPPDMSGGTAAVLEFGD